MDGNRFIVEESRLVPPAAQRIECGMLQQRRPRNDLHASQFPSYVHDRANGNITLDACSFGCIRIIQRRFRKQSRLFHPAARNHKASKYRTRPHVGNDAGQIGWCDSPRRFGRTMCYHRRSQGLSVQNLPFEARVSGWRFSVAAVIGEFSIPAARKVFGDDRHRWERGTGIVFRSGARRGIRR